MEHDHVFDTMTPDQARELGQRITALATWLIVAAQVSDVDALGLLIELLTQARDNRLAESPYSDN
jgi:hypothetical protein